MKIQAIIFLLLICHSVKADLWTRKADFTADRGEAVAFSIGTKGYVGTGRNNLNLTRDLWSYDPVSDSWTQMADLPGAARCQAFGFAIGVKGYIGEGLIDSLPAASEFYEYNPVSNIWSIKADFPGDRYAAVAFSIGNKGYVATGLSTVPLHKDLMEYDPVANTWTAKAEFAGGGRCWAFGFAINGKGYIGGGSDSTTSIRQDFFEYDPTSDSWNQRQDFAGGPILSAAAFGIGNKGYVGPGLGTFSLPIELWQYNPDFNVWTRRADFGGTPRCFSAAFTIGNIGYITGGDSLISGTGSIIPTKTHWAYYPDTLDGINDMDFTSIQIQVYPNPTVESFYIVTNKSIMVSIYDESGKLVRENIKCVGKTKVDLHSFAAGGYFIKADINNRSIVRKFVKLSSNN